MSPQTRQAEPSDEGTLTHLLAAAQAGERAAFGRIHERFARTVHGIVLSHCGAREVDDVTQDVFVSIQSRIHTVAEGEALAGWICRVARNAAIDARRRRQRRPRHEALPELPARDERSDAGLAEHMLARLRALPDTYRETLTLRLVEGMTGPEIAAATGMTPGSVRVNLHRGMTLLRDALREDGWP